MSSLDLMKYSDDRVDFEFNVTCATLLNLTRIISLFAIFYNIALRCKCRSSTSYGHQISLKTLLMYGLICTMEILYCFLEKPDYNMKLLTLISSTTSLIMIIIIAIGVAASISNEHDYDDTSFSWMVMPHFLGFSLVIAAILSFYFGQQHFLTASCSCLNMIALVPEYFILHKVTVVNVSVRVFIIGMLVHTTLLIPEAMFMSSVFGFQAEYHQFVFIGFTYFFNWISYLAKYPRNAISPEKNRWRKNRDGQSERETDMSNLGSSVATVASQQNLRDATNAAAALAGDDDDNKPVEQNVTVSKKVILQYHKPEVYIVGQENPSENIELSEAVVEVHAVDLDIQDTRL